MVAKPRQTLLERIIGKNGTEDRTAKNNLTTLITIKNYEQYQGNDTANGTPDGTPDGTQTRIIKNVLKERGAKRKSRRTIPPDFQLSTEMIAYAAKYGINGDRVNQVFENFRDYHAAKGSIFADWSAAWRTWARREVEFKSNRPQADPIPKPIEPPNVEELFANE